MPISIGMIRADGVQLYLVNADAPWVGIRGHVFLRDHVLPHLPHRDMPVGNGETVWRLDRSNPAVVPLRDLRHSVRLFVTGTVKDAEEEVDLWAWYAAYDHVVLAQLFGTMIDLPSGIPMWTNDLRQEVRRLGITQEEVRAEVPKTDEHHALADAVWNRELFWYLQRTAEKRGHCGPGEAYV
jgi:hypothetical protein